MTSGMTYPTTPSPTPQPLMSPPMSGGPVSSFRPVDPLVVTQMAIVAQQAATIEGLRMDLGRARARIDDLLDIDGSHNEAVLKQQLNNATDKLKYQQAVVDNFERFRDAALATASDADAKTCAAYEKVAELRARILELELHVAQRDREVAALRSGLMLQVEQ